MGQGAGGGEEITVVAGSECSAGGVPNPDGGMNGGASTFKGFPCTTPPNEDGIEGVGRDLGATEFSMVGLLDGDLRRRSSCRLFARGRTPTPFPQRVSSETERLRNLIKGQYINSRNQNNEDPTSPPGLQQWGGSESPPRFVVKEGGRLRVGDVGVPAARC